tara:strand:- start:2260 stop:3186 length:927 start_codon:yes stop_codon:yes gene_type:complete
MKAIMYHYVRKYNSNLPFFRFLDISNFSKQLDYFSEKFGFISKKEWIRIIKEKSLKNSKNKILLTFDDAMSCHYKYVFPELKKRNLWGIFYVPTKPYQNKKILDVHRIHLLTGVFSGKELMNTLLSLLNDRIITHEKIKEFREKTYTRQDNYEGVSEFKRILNYFVDYNYRELLIDKVANQLNYRFKPLDFYVPLEKLREMHAFGNIIGSHTVSHPVMSRLNKKEQSNEIIDSFSFLEEMGFLNTKTYCHPYGGFHSFNQITVKTLKSLNIEYSFNVECRDIEDKDLENSIQFLPRYDCNQFPYGKVS